MNVNINKEITVDITLIPKANKTYEEKYCIYIGFTVYAKGHKQNAYCISTGININKSEWEHGEATGRNDKAKLINERLNEYLSNAKIMIIDLSQKKPKTASEVMKEIKANAKQRITGKAAKQTKDSKIEFTSRLRDYDYQTIMNKYLAFAKPCHERQLKYKVPFKLLLAYFENDLPLIDAITSEDLEGFKYWLVDKFKAKVKEGDTFKVNTIVSYCCMIAAVFNYAKKLKLITDTPLPKGFSGSFEDGKREIVEEEEIIRIQQINDACLGSGLLKAKYSLLLQSMTGLGIKEMRSIEYKHIKTGIINGEGRDYIEKERTKTGVEYLVVLTENAKFVMGKLMELAGDEKHPFNLCSDSKINRHYRTLGKMAGITKSVAPYQFRHAFAVSYMDNDGRLEDLQKIIGHKDPNTTKIYGKITLTRLSGKTDLLQQKSKMHQLQPTIQSMLKAV